MTDDFVKNTVFSFNLNQQIFLNCYRIDATLEILILKANRGGNPLRNMVFYNHSKFSKPFRRYFLSISQVFNKITVSSPNYFTSYPLPRLGVNEDFRNSAESQSMKIVTQSIVRDD